MKKYDSPTILIGCLFLSLFLFSCSQPITPQAPTTTSVPLPQPIQTGYIEVDHGRLYYEMYGQGPDVVLIHDGLLSQGTWDAQVEALAMYYRVTRYDRRGYGKSDPPQQPYSNVEDLSRLMSALNLKPAALIGLSIGSSIAVDFALAFPNQVSGLVLVGPVVSGWSYSAHFTQRNEANKSVDDWVNDRYLTASGNKAAQQKIRELMNQDIGTYLNLEQFRKAEPSAVERLPEIQVPVLVIAGEGDIADVHAVTGALQVSLPNVKRRIIANAGHLVPIEQPSIFNRMVLDFLSGLPK